MKRQEWQKAWDQDIIGCRCANLILILIAAKITYTSPMSKQKLLAKIQFTAFDFLQVWH